MRQSASTVRVGISGSYGGMNTGDEAILEGIVSQLRASVPAEITVFTRNTAHTLTHHQVDHAVPIRDLTREEARAEVERLDVLVLGGGGILYDRDAEAYLREVTLAHEVGIPVMVYAVSAGPLQDPAARELVREALSRAAVVTVRDRKGQRLLEEVGLHREIIVTADPALLLEAEELPDQAVKVEGLTSRQPIIAFSVREPGPAAPDIDVTHYHALLANAADFVIERLDARVVFIPMERRKMDLQHSHAVIAQMLRADRATVLQNEYTPRQLISLISHFDFSVGMRLHFLIFSALAGVPFVALPYASKVTGLVEDLEMETPPLNDVNSGRLLAIIDRSWDRQKKIRKQVQRLLPGLQDRARQTNELLVELIRQRVAVNGVAV
ncbi:MAG TPA: polysaccharide pyruvyl transferase family protein [Rhodothermales bacterium]